MYDFIYISEKSNLIFGNFELSAQHALVISVYTILCLHQSSPSLLLPVSRFVKYTGYGNAAGLLVTRGLLGGQGSRTYSPEAQYSSDSDSDTEEYRQVKDRINPVTGRVEVEQPDPMEGMTEDEKEEEAKRLIMLFNKLSRSDIDTKYLSSTTFD